MPIDAEVEAHRFISRFDLTQYLHHPLIFTALLCAPTGHQKTPSRMKASIEFALPWQFAEFSHKSRTYIFDSRLIWPVPITD
jgi:hypothetical protein